MMAGGRLRVCGMFRRRRRRFSADEVLRFCLADECSKALCRSGPDQLQAMLDQYGTLSVSGVGSFYQMLVG